MGVIAYVTGGSALAAVLSLWWALSLYGDLAVAESELEERAAKIKELSNTARVNQVAVDVCRGINAENTIARIEAEERAAKAQERIRILQRDADATITIIKEQSDGFRTNDELCRTLGDPLPVDFVDWVFSE